MKSKVYLLALLITLSGTSIFAQEGNNNRVTVEDQGVNSEYKKNDEEFRKLDKQFDDLMASFLKTYKNLYDTGFSKFNGDFSKEKLGVFISAASSFKNSINNNTQVSNLNNQLNNLAKVTSRSDRDYVAYFKNSLLPRVDGDIASANSIISNIERNESKKELSVGFGNTNSSSSNTNTDNNSDENSQSNTSTNSKRSISETIAGTWVSSRFNNTKGIKHSYNFSSNGTGYQILPDEDNKCAPYYYKSHFRYEVNDKGGIDFWFTKIDDYCGYQYNAQIVREIYPKYHVLDSNEIFSGAFTDGEGDTFKKE